MMLELNGKSHPKRKSSRMSHFETQAANNRRRRSGTKNWSPLTRTGKAKTQQWDPLSRSGRKVILQQQLLVQENGAQQTQANGCWVPIIVIVILLALVGVLFWKPWDNNSSTVAPVSSESSSSETQSSEHNIDPPPSEQTSFWSSYGKNILWTLGGCGVLYAGYECIPSVKPFVTQILRILGLADKKVVHDLNYEGLKNIHGINENLRNERYGMPNMKVYKPDETLSSIPYSHGKSDAQLSDTKQMQSRMEEIEKSLNGSEIKNGISYKYTTDTSEYGTGTRKKRYCEFQRSHRDSWGTQNIEWGEHARCGTRTDWREWLKSDKSLKPAKTGDKLWNGDDYTLPDRDFVRKNSQWKWLDGPQYNSFYEDIVGLL